jgi:hypothetical protein
MSTLQKNELDVNYKLYDRYHPYLYSLNKVNWFIFGSLTWKFESRRGLSEKAQWLRRRDFSGLLTSFCNMYRLRGRHLAYYRATEFGNAAQPHFHFLIAKKNLEHLSAGDCSQTLKQFWEQILRPYDCNSLGIGSANVVAYNEAFQHPAVKYCLKREFDYKGDEWERYDFMSEALRKLIIKENGEPIEVKACMIDDREVRRG